MNGALSQRIVIVSFMKIDCKVILSGEKVDAQFWEQRSLRIILALVGSLGARAHLCAHTQS